MTTSPNGLRSRVASASFSVVPKRKGPWMRRMVTLAGISLSWRMWAWPSRRYSRVTGATVVVSAMR